MEEEFLTPFPFRDSCSLHPPSPVLTHEQEKKRKEIGSQHFFLEKAKIMQKEKEIRTFNTKNIINIKHN